MDREQRIAYINAMVACASIELAGMMAANIDAKAAGLPLPYHQPDIQGLIDRHGISHNAVIGFFTEA